MLAAAAMLAAQAAALDPAERDARELAQMLIGTWNNAEAVAFAKERGADGPAPVTVVIAFGEEGGLRYEQGRRPGALGPALPLKATIGVPKAKEGSRAGGACEVAAERVGDAFSLEASGAACEDASVLREGVLLTGDAMVAADGAVLRRADPYRCWVSRKKDEDGWTWTPDVEIREGEYHQLPSDPEVARPAALRLRHVRWPEGRNRDSLVLYVHEGEDDPAVAYAWTEPDGARIAINLRWVQASCTRMPE